MKHLLTIILTSTVLYACGQTNSGSISKNNQQEIITKDTTMDTSKLTNENVKKAIEALQSNDKTAWYSCFTEDAAFTDDGRTLDFKPFFDNAFDKKEKFLTIDKIENDGKDIYGNFYAGQWGTFNVYFKFHQNSEGKINRLDIGQTR